MLNFSYTLFISTDLGPLVLLVSGDQVLLTIGGGMGIEYLTSKWTLSNPPPPQKLFAAMSSLAPSSVIAVALLRASPVITLQTSSLPLCLGSHCV